MDILRYRKYPRVHNRKSPGKNERTLSLSGKAAIGILALSFFKGMFWGYFIKKRLD